MRGAADSFLSSELEIFTAESGALVVGVVNDDDPNCAVVEETCPVVESSAVPIWRTPLVPGPVEPRVEPEIPVVAAVPLVPVLPVVTGGTVYWMRNCMFDAYTMTVLLLVLLERARMRNSAEPGTTSERMIPLGMLRALMALTCRFGGAMPCQSPAPKFAVVLSPTAVKNCSIRVSSEHWLEGTSF
jgi:hypothetical protein